MVETPKTDDLKNDVTGAFRVRLPGFVEDEAVGLGDAVKRVTYALGMNPCGGCERRVAAMNRWMVFTK
jgi:hypothetical protein